MSPTTTVSNMLTALGVILAVAAILTVDVLLGETIVAPIAGVLVLVGIPAWVIWEQSRS